MSLRGPHRSTITSQLVHIIKMIHESLDIDIATEKSAPYHINIWLFLFFLLNFLLILTHVPFPIGQERTLILNSFQRRNEHFAIFLKTYIDSVVLTMSYRNKYYTAFITIRSTCIFTNYMLSMYGAMSELLFHNVFSNKHSSILRFHITQGRI